MRTFNFENYENCENCELPLIVSYDMLKPPLTVLSSVLKWIYSSFPVDTELGGTLVPQYFPICDELVELPSRRRT